MTTTGYMGWLDSLRSNFKTSSVDGLTYAESAEPGTHAIVAYAPDFSFLREGLIGKCHLVRTDDLSATQLRWRDGAYFVVRGVDSNCLSVDDIVEITNTTKHSFRNCRLERVVGYFFDRDDGQEELLVHTFSAGLDLSSIPPRAPPHLRRTIASLLASALAELHGHGIIYSEATPNNFRYDFTRMLNINPHQYMLLDESESSLGEKAQDLWLISRNCPWLPSITQFVNEYCEKIGLARRRSQEFHALLEALESSLQNGHDSPLAVQPFWMSR